MQLHNTIFAGPAGSGKSTLINAILDSVPNHKVVVLYDYQKGNTNLKGLKGTIFIETQDITLKIPRFKRIIIEP